MNKEVIVISSPISDRYGKKGSRATIDTKTNMIRCGGAWFHFDEKFWEYTTPDKVIYFRKGYRDATDIEDYLQTVGIDIVSMQVADESELTFESDIPYNLKSFKSKEELIDNMIGKGWELCD